MKKNLALPVLIVTLIGTTVMCAGCGKDPGTLMESAAAAAEQGDYDLAIADYTRAIQLDPDNQNAKNLSADLERRGY